MEGITGALARITELQGKLSTLRPPVAAGRFGALLQQAPVPAAPAAAAPADAAPSAAWLSAQRPASLSRGSMSPASLSAAVGAAAPAGRTYPNGQIPDSALTSIGGNERLTARAAEGFAQLRAAAARDGVELPVNDSYRSLAEQEDMARRKGLYSQGGLAAKPGTSTHGLGLSVDLELDGKALAWLRENGKGFGFVEDVPREPWHWTFAPS